jgi:hypothetical protein
VDLRRDRLDELAQVCLGVSVCRWAVGEGVGSCRQRVGRQVGTGWELENWGGARRGSEIGDRNWGTGAIA